MFLKVVQTLCVDPGQYSFKYFHVLLSLSADRRCLADVLGKRCDAQDVQSALAGCT